MAASHFPIEIKDPLERLIATWNAPWPEEVWAFNLRKHISPLNCTLHASPAPGSSALSTTTWLLTVALPLCNTAHNLHGGCTSTIFDLLSSMSLAPHSKPGFWRYAGVSRTLNVSYLKPIPEGMIVVVGCETLSIGKKGCVLRCWMREWDEEIKEAKGELLAVCEHGKASVDHLFRLEEKL